MTATIEAIVSLCKRRGYIFPGSDIYGGLANSWDYGPLGVELKNNIKALWWKMFVHRRDDVVGIDAALIMNPKVWEASGHVANFSDPLVECKACHDRFRVDQIIEEKVFGLLDSSEKQLEHLQSNVACPNCQKKNWDTPKQFNLMFKTYIGPVEDAAHVAYMRPETAQAMFVDFSLVNDVLHRPLPLGIAQIGKAFRNEITPGNFIFRTREFEQMEIEYFIPEPKSESDWQTHFAHWQAEMHQWMKLVGIDTAKVHELEIPDGERAHYSKRTIDFEFDFPFGRKELYGLAYRTNFDLTNHQKASGKPQTYKNLETNEEYIPHVIEPTWGVDRTVLAVLCSAYEEQENDGKPRTVLHLPSQLAPYKAAVFPLVRNKPEITQKARSVYKLLKEDITVAWDDRGNIGKRYFSQDEIGTPWCITVDYTTLEDDTVTIRNRDTMQQERIATSELVTYITSKMKIS